MRKLYEIFNLLLIQKRIVAAATKLGNTVIKVIQIIRLNALLNER